MTEQQKQIDEIQLTNAAYKDVLRSEAGQRILEDLSAFCGENANPYVEGSFDRTAQKCGKLSVILHIRKRLSSEDKPLQSTVKNERTE